MQDVVGIPFDTLAPSALAGLSVLLVLLGRLVPRRTYDDKVHEAAEWRTEARLKDQQIHELTEQNTAMLQEFGPTLHEFLRDLRAAAESMPEEGQR